MTENNLPDIQLVDSVDRISHLDDVQIGQWYWVKTETNRDKDDPIVPPEGYRWLGCVIDIGSNYVQIKEPGYDRSGGSSWRVHYNEFWDECLHEPNAEQIIADNINHHQRRVTRQMNHVKKITRELGIPSQKLLRSSSDELSSSSTELATLSGTTDVAQYKKQLIKTKEKILPKLFKRIKVGNKIAAKWMAAESVSLEASLNLMEEDLEGINGRIFNVSLYAGLVETTAHVKKGEPAAYHEKVNLMQRLIYMDEECLLDYEHGGMTFESILDFDRWLSKPNNFTRLLPFEKTVAAFRVRRNTKQRVSSDLSTALINMQLQKQDMYTFLYIRNGENLYRLGIEDFEFDEKIFPDQGAFDPSEPMMAKTSCGRVESLITVREYEQRKAEKEEQKRLEKQWYLDNPFEEWKKARYDAEMESIEELRSDEWRSVHDISRRVEQAERDLKETSTTRWTWDNPHSKHDYFRHQNYDPFDNTNVYYDDIMKKMKDEMDKFNRVALIIQGLFDRSDVFQPCPPAETWKANGFEAAINLVYDASMVLHYGEAPDIELYIAECNKLARKDSIFIGQQAYWEILEEEKGNERNSWGNPGPGYLAKAHTFQPRAKKAIFTWNRKRLDWSHPDYDGDIRTTVTVPLDELFNVSAYQLGDYKKFFQDPRTRKNYLKWANLLLVAEEYHAGNREAIEPIYTEAELRS